MNGVIVVAYVVAAVVVERLVVVEVIVVDVVELIVDDEVIEQKREVVHVKYNQEFHSFFVMNTIDSYTLNQFFLVILYIYESRNHQIVDNMKSK